MNWAHSIKSCFRCLQWDRWFSYSFLGVIYMADGPELWEKPELLLFVAVWRHSDKVGIYSCWNSGCKNSLSLDCVRLQSSITPSTTSSWVSHSYSSLPPSGSSSSTLLSSAFSPEFAEILLARLLEIRKYLHYLSSTQRRLDALN